MKKAQRMKRIIKIRTPIDNSEIQKLRIGDQIEIQGKILCGRDAVLPKLVALSQNSELHRIRVNLKGSVIFHTAVSIAGIGPTTSNKVEIEGNIPELSKAGVKIHLGKGSLSQETTQALKEHCAIFAITPPVTALFADKIVSQKVVAFNEEGMEALYEVEVKALPAIVAIAQGETVFSQEQREK